MKRLTIIAVLALAIFAGAAAVGQAKVPGFGLDDVCACGGQITYTYHHQETYPGYRQCWYEGRAPNGTVVNYLGVPMSLVQTCPYTP